jgi:ferredoxin--NADP+ reductase
MSHRIAILGAGPAGCYTAQALRKALPEAEITVIDRLPVPYGLVRYGVAADHQGTKGVTRQFARVFERQDVAFWGGIEVGRDITIDQLKQSMDAIVWATGLDQDRTLGVPGDRLEGVYGSGAVTRYWNGHPDDVWLDPEFGRRVVVFGNGNVALDVVRLLSKSGEELDGSDFDPELLDHDVREIHVIGRSDLGQAKFDIAMVKELASIADLKVSIADADSVTQTDVSKAVFDVAAVSAPHASRQVIFHSGWVCEHLISDEARIAAVHLRRRDGSVQKTIDCDSVVTAIGFEQGEALDTMATGADRTSGVLGGGMFATGWYRRGPQGTIPENRADAIEVSQKVADWLGAQHPGDKGGRKALESLLATSPVTYDDWLLVDKHERATSATNRCRKKARTRQHMMDIIQASRG